MSDLGYSTVVLMSCQLLTIGEVWIVTCCCWPVLLNVGPFQEPSSLSTGNFAYTKRIICILCRTQWAELCHFNANTPTVTQCFVPLHASRPELCRHTPCACLQCFRTVETFACANQLPAVASHKL